MYQGDELQHFQGNAKNKNQWNWEQNKRKTFQTKNQLFIDWKKLGIKK